MAFNEDLNLLSSYHEHKGMDFQSLLDTFPYRPTLFLGLGGTGANTVCKIKDLFTTLYKPIATQGQDANVPEIPPMYAFLAFDTSKGERPDNLREGKEWFHLGVEDLGSFYKGIGKDRFFRDWVIKDYPAGSITAGASGFRNLGRLALINNISTLRDQLLNAAAQIRTTHIQIDNAQPVVFIFCSLSGGTGSGMLLDTCFVLRNLMPEAEIKGLIAILDGLPTIPEITRKDIRVNTFASLKELNCYMSRTAEGVRFDEPVRYPFNVDGVVREPLDECYLTSSRKEDGTISLISQNHVTSFLARLAFMMSAYSFKARGQQSPGYAGILNNHTHHLTGSIRGASKCYMVPGLGQIHFPIDRTANLFTLEMGIRYIKYLCKGTGDENGEAATAFFKTNRLEYTSIRNKVGMNPKVPEASVTAQSYDDIITRLLDDKDGRYKQPDKILSYGKKMPLLRLNEIETFMAPNVETICADVAREIEAQSNQLLVSPTHRALGTIDFLEDLEKLLQNEIRRLDEETAASIDKEINAVERQWAEIEGIITDVVTDDGIFDMDWFKVPKAKAIYITFLNSAEVLVLEKARSELCHSVLSRTITEISNRIDQLKQLILQDLPGAKDLMQKRKDKLSNRLYRQTEGVDDDVMNICSFNVMNQQWRDAYFNRSTRFTPESVQAELLNKNWHPARMLAPQPDTKNTKAEYIAQTLADQIASISNFERRWTPMDVLTISSEYRGKTPEQIIAKLYFKILQPQMQIGEMKARLGTVPHELVFCGGISSALQEQLQSSDELKGTQFNVADNLEKNRINFFSISLPVSMAGCNLIQNVFGNEYEKFNQELQETARDQREFMRSRFHCFPGSYRWPSPLRYHREMTTEKEFFARALAVSLMLQPDEHDVQLMKSAGKTPKDKRYGLFQVGRSQFWMMPFFRPQSNTGGIEGKLMGLGTNVLEAYRKFSLEENALESGRQWVRWMEENWSQFFNTPQIDALKREATQLFLERKSKTDHMEQIQLWDEFKQLVEQWEIG